MKSWRAFVKVGIVLLFWVAMWHILAAKIGKELLLPTPLSVMQRLGELVVMTEFWRITSVSLIRILGAVFAAIVVGTILAVLSCRFSILRALFAPLLTVIKATPVASFIILALIWMNRDILPSFIAFLMALPIIWTNVSTGIERTDVRLLQVACVYRFSAVRTCRRIYIPSVMPYFLSACQSSMGLAWKAGIAAEVLTVPAVSVGKMLYESKLYLQTTDLFAWTVVVILCSLFIEKTVMAAIGRLGREYGLKGVREK